MVRRTREMAKRIETTLQNYLGTQDYLSGDAIARRYVREFLRGIFEEFGFDEHETPAIELGSILTGKYGEEADKAIFLFSSGGDEIGLRFDLTVPLARVVGMRFIKDELPLPYKRYQMAPVWRADKPAVEQGRFREFWQCDVDIVGSKSMMADAEIIGLVYTALRRLKLSDFTIRLNDRKLLDAMVGSLGVKDRDEALEIYRVIDKFDKLGEIGVHQQLLERDLDVRKSRQYGEVSYSIVQAIESESERVYLSVKKDDGEEIIGPLARDRDYGIDYETGALDFREEIEDDVTPIVRVPFLSRDRAERIMNLIGIGGTNREKLNKMREELAGQDLIGIDELEGLLGYLESLGIEERYSRIDFSLARGLDYYTGPIFETAVERPKIGSITGGGRFDHLIEQLGGPDLPATGTTFGLERLVAVMRELELLPPTQTTVQVLVTIFSPELANKSLEIVSRLREDGFNAEIYLDTQAGLGKQLRYADRKGVPIVLIPGPDELKEGKVALKQLGDSREAGKQQVISLDELSTVLQQILDRSSKLW